MVLIAMLAALALGASYFVYAGLNRGTSTLAVQQAAHDAEVLARAKRALIGLVATNTASAAEPNPGRLPCPEALADAGTANEGLPAGATGGNPLGACGPVAIGRLPWKALGIDKLVDSAAEPLWYAVAANWVPATAATELLINSETPALGGLTLSGTDAVAIIFAPGAALPGQPRAAISGAVAPQVASYLDGENAAPLDAAFVAGAAGAAFNDRSLALSRAELLPHIEAAVADRFERQLARAMRDAYSTAPWTSTPTLPFAAPFGDPSVAPANLFQGAAGTTRGLLPASYATTGACTCAPAPCACTPAACDATADARCDASFVTWLPAATTVAGTGGATYREHSCSVAGTPPVLNCAIRASTTLLSFSSWMSFDIGVRASNVAMALRRVNGTVPVSGVDTSSGASVNPPYGYAVGSAQLNTDGSATLVLSSRFASGSGTPLAVLGALTCNILGIPLCYEYTLSIPIMLLSDHAAVDPADAATNWFYRNRWHELAHYAVAAGVAPDQAAPRSCNTVPAAVNPCLEAAFLSTATADPGAVRGLVVFAGQPLATAARPAGQVRPSADPLDWFEDANVDVQTPYAVRAPALLSNRSFNDRIVVLDHN